VTEVLPVALATGKAAYVRLCIPHMVTIFMTRYHAERDPYQYVGVVSHLLTTWDTLPPLKSLVTRATRSNHTICSIACPRSLAAGILAT
jgi:hypothetical protein